MSKHHPEEYSSDLFQPSLSTYLSKRTGSSPHLCAGGGIVNIFSRYRTPEIVCAEYFLQVPWACWLLGGGCCGITFALCLFACGLYTDTEMKAFNRSPVTSHRTVRKKKRPVAAVDDRFHSQRKCILAFAVAVHIWLLQSVAASVHMPVWPASQWLKLGVSCYVVFSLWKPANDKLVGSWSLRPSLPWRK